MPSSSLPLVFLITAALQFSPSRGQSQIGHTVSNECRHVCILSRAKPSAIRSTDCHLPLKTSSRHAITLRNSISEESHWTLDHNGAVNGQLMYVAKDKVVFLSQKVCLDAGQSVGFPIFPIYDRMSNKSKPNGRAGDFDYRPGHGDIFQGCIENKTPWSAFQFKRNITESGAPLPRGATQYVKIHVGRHEGKGFRIVPFNFSYSPEDLEDLFKLALRQAQSEKPVLLPAEEPLIRSGKPIIVKGFSFETGHSLVGVEKIPPTEAHKDFYNDITVLAWQRLQEAVASLHGKPTPLLLLPEDITYSELLAVTVLAVISIVTFRNAVTATADARREQVFLWRRKSQSKFWTCVTAPSDHKYLARYPAPTSKTDLSAVMFSFIIAAVAIISAILQFRRTSLRFRQFFMIRQGILITYGPSMPHKWALDRQNQLAGAVFAVGHWYAVETVRAGRPGIFEIILAAYCFSGLYLIWHFYRFATLREHAFDYPRFRRPTQFIRAVLQALLGFTVDYIPGAGRHLRSYRTTYLQYVDDIAQFHGLDKFEPQVKFSKRWDGNLVLPPRKQDRTQLTRPPCLQGGHDSMCLTPEQVEKAAGFLAADKFGKLRYAQAISLLSSKTLMKAASDCHRGNIPRAEDIRSFCLLFHVEAVLLPEASENGITSRDFTILASVDNGAVAAQRKYERLAVVLPPPEDDSSSAELLQFATLN